MTRRPRVVLSVVLGLGLFLGLGLGLAGCGRGDRQAAEELRAAIASLETERESLRTSLDDLVEADARLAEMPEAPVRIGVPTSLSRELIERAITGVVDLITLELTGLEVRKQGTIRRLIPLGDYDLRLRIDRVTASIKTGTPIVAFDKNAVSLSVPLSITSTSGRATVRFIWDGRTVGGAVCGDVDVTEVVTGRVRPKTYTLKGSLALTATETEIVATPKLPTTRINLGVAPSAASWASLQKVVDDKRGVCGFVLDRIDVIESVRELVGRGFTVRLPTEKARSMAIPVSVAPSMLVNDTPVDLGITVGELSVTASAIWLGAHVSVNVGTPPPR